MNLARYVIPYTTCPMCMLEIESIEFLNHVMEEHPYFFVVWASMNMPTFHTDALLYDSQGVEDTSYEFLSELCDRIGYHRQGVRNIDEVTEYVFPSEDNMTTCPICLDDVIVGRKMNVCTHAFCATCIEKWLTEHKTCPVCIRDITDQMASISISPSGPNCPEGPTSPSSINTT